MTQPHERDGALPARAGRPVGARSSLASGEPHSVSLSTRERGAPRSLPTMPLPLPSGCQRVCVGRSCAWSMEGEDGAAPAVEGHVLRAHGNTAPRPRGGSAVWGVRRE